MKSRVPVDLNAKHVGATECIHERPFPRLIPHTQDN